MASRRSNLVEGVKLVLEAAIAANNIGTTSDSFDLQRADFINLDLRSDQTSEYVVRVMARSSKTKEPERANIPQEDSVNVMVIRRLPSDTLTDAERQEFVDACCLVMEQIEDTLLKRDNSRPWQLVSGAEEGPIFAGHEYRTNANQEAYIYNPEGLSARRQFESRLVAKYSDVRSTE